VCSSDLFDAQRERGLGLVGMQERVANLGGVFQVESRPGKGTQVRAWLPLRASQMRPVATAE
jgi:signal transduction histidine kinase